MAGLMLVLLSVLWVQNIVPSQCTDEQRGAQTRKLTCPKSLTNRKWQILEGPVLAR